MVKFQISKQTYIYGGIIPLVILIGFFAFSHSSIDVFNGTASINKTKSNGPISGMPCEGPVDRPLAVMLSSDPEARPLSGIGAGDITFEMPVTPSGVTRIMSVFQCDIPDEIGSVRSARLDFVPLALGFDVIYGHFGGEHLVLEELNNKIIDNVDGLKYDGTIYYRKPTVPRPHNAFTSKTLLKEIIKKLDYRITNTFVGYPHEKKSSPAESDKIIQPPAIYEGQFQVNWKYNEKSNSYLRLRNNNPEIDKNTDKQVEVKNVIVLETAWSPISKDYLRIKTIGSGNAIIYKNGLKISGKWQKGNDKAKLFFYDNAGKEIELAPGKIWVEITAPLP